MKTTDRIGCSGSPAEPRTDGLTGWGVVLAVFAIGFLTFPLRVVGVGLDHLPGDLVDARLNHYVLEHGYRHLRGAEPEFWHAPMFYPARRITAYSDAHLGMLPVYATLRMAGLSPESAFQGWFLLPFALNYAACVWAIRRLGFSPVAVAAGAYLFAFALPLATSQTQHAQLGPRFLVPIALVLGWEWAWRPTLGRLAGLAACLVGQAYLTLYVGYFLGLLLLIQWGVTATLFRRSLPWSEVLQPGARHWAARFVVLLLAVVALLPLFLPHARAASEHGHYPVETIREFCPTPLSWLTPAHLAWHRDWTEPLLQPRFEFPAEHQLFPGLLPIAAWLIALVGLRRRVPIVTVSAGVVLVGTLLVTRFGEYALYEPLLHLPGTAGMRTLGRLVLLLLFPLAVLVAALMEGLLEHARRWGRLPAAVVAMLGLGLLVADQWLVAPDGPRGGDWAAIRHRKAEAVHRRERLMDVIRTHPQPRLVYVFPAFDAGEMDWLAQQLDAMVAAQQLGLPTVNGWSGYWPRGWRPFPGYTGLLQWLTEEHRVPDEMLRGLVVIGEPRGDDPEVERELRARFPPRRLP